MRVILAEKPSVARDLARSLGCTQKEQGFFRGSRDLVTWAIGHLVQFAEPAAMNPAWGQPWRRDALPMLPRTWRLVPEPGTADQFQIVSRLFNDPSVTGIVNATDAGREGEAIFRRIYALSGSHKPVMRFWTSSLTGEAIAEAFRRLRPSAELDSLAAAALTRAQLDWLIGMNHSRAATLHNSVTCSVGRVQTPTLAMIVRRHHHIAGFLKSFFFEVHADLGDFVARALNPAWESDRKPDRASGEAPEPTPSGRHAFDRKEEAETILADVPPGSTAEVTEVEVRAVRTPPPQLHNLGELQKEANRRFGLPADRTLAIAQALYENKLITYPRSSSRHLSEDMVGGLPAILRALRLGPDREPHIASALHRAGHGPKLSKRFVDGSKLSDHHAIIPTAKPAPANLPQDERRVYALVAERFLGIFLPDKETEETRVDLQIEKHPFQARGTRLIAPGWTVLHGKEDFSTRPDGMEDRQPLPALKQGEELPVLDSELVTRERKPPPRYTDATLLAAMETAGRDIEDDDLRAAMKGRGLGTEATRAAIIQRLLDLSYVERDGKFFSPTGKGIALIGLLNDVLPHLASPEMTGDMEAKLHQVEEGTLQPESLLEETAASLRRDIPIFFRAKPMEAPPAAPIQAGKGQLLCPACKAGVLTRQEGSKGVPYLRCVRSREGCSFTLNTVVAGKRLTEGNMKDLCSPARQHRTRLIKGFKAKTGRPFDARLFLNPASGLKAEFSFDR